MGKLEFKHLQNYPKGLRVLRPEWITDNNHSEERVESEYKGVYYDERTEQPLAMVSGFRKIPLSLITPKLRTFDSLTDKEWIEIFQAGMDEGIKSFVNDNPIGIHKHGNVIRLYDELAGFKVVIPSKTFVSYDIKGYSFHTSLRFDMLKSFDKMYEMHLDVNHLIPEKLAIDIETLKL